MKRELDYIIKQAQKPDTKVPLLTKEELKNIVDASITKKQIPNKITRRIIMSGFSALIIAGALFLLLPGTQNSVQQEVKHNVIEKKSNNIEENKQTPVMLQDVPKYSTSNLTNTDTNSNQDVIIRMVPDTVPPNGKPIKRYPERIDVNAIKFLELTDEEFEKIVPNTKLNDTSYAIYEEYYFNDKYKFNFWRLDTLGYKIEDMPFIVQRYNLYNPNKQSWVYQHNKYSNKNEYSKTLNVGYSFINTGAESYISEFSFRACPLLHVSKDTLYREFNDYDIVFNNIMPNPNRKINDTERDSLFKRMLEFDRKLFASLIPIKRDIPRFGKGYCLLWFVPNEEFLAVLPERYSVPLRKELEIKEKFEKQLIQLDEACKGLSGQETYFDICKTQSGAIESISTIPNKAESSIQVDILLKESRKLYISLYDLTGKLVKKFESYNLEAGKQSINLNIGNIQNGIFLLSVQSDKSELVVQKVFIL